MAPDRWLRNDPTMDRLAGYFEVENTQTFHLKELYKYIHDYLIDEEGYKSFWDDDKPEIFYFERQHPDGSREHHIWWRLYKCPQKSQYFRRLLKIDIQTLAMGKNEIIKNGQKMKMDKGNIIIRIQGFLQLDYKNEWKKHWFLKHWEHYFRKRIFKSQIDYQKAQFYKNLYKLQHKIKQYLDLATPTRMPSPYVPPKSVRY